MARERKGRPPGGFPGRTPTAAEQELLERAMAEVAPLKSRSPRLAPTLHPLPGQRVRLFSREAAAAPPPLSLERPAGDARIAGMDGAKQRRLIRGELAIDARLDLHGLTREAAHRRLDQFLRRAEGEGWRCLLVITGRGRGPIDEPPAGILREALPRWLNAPDHRHRVLGWHPARREHGGDGAFYVLLRRQR